MTPKGFIGLQVRAWISDDDHETLEGAKVRFKNIQLKPFSPKPARAGSATLKDFPKESPVIKDRDSSQAIGVAALIS
jgi:hypothetical protein